VVESVALTPLEHNGIGMTSARARDRLIELLRREGISNSAVLERIRSVPRHLFVDEALASRAYENTVLPIGHGQTISQPFVVALMTEALIREGDKPRELIKVLEIGTGCGYQTAVLAPFVRHIYSIERVNALVKRSAQQLRALRINNVSLRHSDGTFGWPSQAPFQGILVAAAPENVPARLLEQLDEGGRLLIPTGRRGRQALLCVTRRGNEFERTELLPVSFVPLLEGTES
jgi:protein-L-isoaspartate(D-aspartate) O-methyltransferase